jgi:hypothetical protein
MIQHVFHTVSTHFDPQKYSALGVRKTDDLAIRDRYGCGAQSEHLCRVDDGTVAYRRQYDFSYHAGLGGEMSRDEVPQIRRRCRK